MTRMVATSSDLRAYKKKYNFFETPEKIAVQMGDLLEGLGRGARILEPSAGRGALIRAALPFLHDSAIVEYCEVQENFKSHLAGWGCVGDDFLIYNPGRVYDAVIMNPPYAKDLAAVHVDHAWECLKPGGRLVALVGETGARHIDEEYYGHFSHRVEFEKGFEETTVKTFLYLIHVPLY